MGVAAVACVAGCACKPSSFDAQDEDKGVSVFLNHRVQARVGGLGWAEGAAGAAH